MPKFASSVATFSLLSYVLGRMIERMVTEWSLPSWLSFAPESYGSFISGCAYALVCALFAHMIFHEAIDGVEPGSGSHRMMRRVSFALAIVSTTLLLQTWAVAVGAMLLKSTE